MKKPIKITLLVFAALTLILIVFTVITLSSVSGYSLLHTNSDWGSFCSATYRWLIIACLIFAVVWVAIAIKYRKSIFSAIKNLVEKIKHLFSSDGHAKRQNPPPQNIQNETLVFCTQCGKQISSSDQFCHFCGKPVDK